MPVVIDQVEVDATPPAAGPAPVAGESSTRPPDMIRIQLELRRDRDRRERRWAD